MSYSGIPDGLMEPWERREVWLKARASSPRPSINFASQRERKEVNTRPCCSCQPDRVSP